MILQKSGPTSNTYISQRLKLHYLDWGNPDASPLLLLHGGRDHCRNWDWVAEHLREDWHIIAPDLRGHGDSEWSNDGQYNIAAYIYDVAQLIHQLKLAPLAIIGHSLGGNIALRYSGIYPENVTRLIAIEGLGPTPEAPANGTSPSVDARLRSWIDRERGLATRLPRRYRSLDEALARMQEVNAHLSRDQAMHLTRHGISQNEDGTFSWKFDNYLRVRSPYDLPPQEVQSLWSSISCPVLLVCGEESWASNPAQDGRAQFFRDAEVVSFARAGHWVHHDRLEDFTATAKRFLGAGLS